MVIVPVGADGAGVAALRRLGDSIGVGGIQLAGGPARRAAIVVDSLRRESPLPLLVLARLDRGVGGVLDGATELPAPSELGSAVINTRAAQLVAAEARAVGIDLAWVPGPRLPGAPEVATAVAAGGGPAATAEYLRDLREAGLPAIVTAFDPLPGDSLPVLRWDRAALEAGALGALRSAVHDSAAGVQLAWTSLPSLTGDSVPLPLSRVAVAGLLRRDLAFDGLVVADVGPGSPLRLRFGARAPVAAVGAGADLLLGVDDPAATVRALTLAVEQGFLPRARVDEATRRIFALKERLGLRAPPVDSAAAPPVLRAPASVALAAELHTRAVNVLGGAAATRLRGCARTVVILPPNARLPAFTAELTRRSPGLAALGTPWVARRGPLSLLGGWAGNDAPCVVSVALPGASPRIVDRLPGAPADTAATDSTAPAPPPRRIIHVAFLPSPADTLPNVPGVVLAWGVGDEAQRAAARAVLGVLEREEAAPRALVWPAARVLQRAPAADAAMSADSLARIDRVIREAIAGGVFTSAAVAVARHGKVVKLAGYGVTGGKPVDPAASLFDIASLTKVVGTTAAAMTLVEEGRLQLDAPVRSYVPLFRGGSKGGVTIRHLLTHTSGLPAGADLFNSAREPDQALRQAVRSALKSAPGARLEYSDFGMIVLAEAVRAQADMPLDHYLARRVFGPLGMESTMYLPPVALVQSRTVSTALRSQRPYTLDGVVHDANAFRMGGVAGHAGLFATASDIAVYAQTLLNGGAYGARRVWAPSTVRRFTVDQGLPGHRALGWDRPAPRSSAGDWFGANAFGHTGYTGTSIWIDPARDLFVVLLTNRTYDSGTAAQILAVRASVNTAAVRSITDIRITPRPGTVAARPPPPPPRKPRPTPRRRPKPRGRG
jgi:CubicO group peptidase (beta-lactamase class C family)